MQTSQYHVLIQDFYVSHQRSLSSHHQRFVINTSTHKIIESGSTFLPWNILSNKSKLDSVSFPNVSSGSKFEERERNSAKKADWFTAATNARVSVIFTTVKSTHLPKGLQMSKKYTKPHTIALWNYLVTCIFVVEHNFVFFVFLFWL